MIDVSVIIVNWNTEKLLLDCIGSIIRETQRIKYEIIVVDNASSDDSVQSVKTKYPEVLIIANNENLGFAKANNQGIAVSRGRYVCLVNSDVVVLENSIDKLVEHIDTDSSIAVIAPMTVDRNLRIRENVRKFPKLWHVFCETFFLHRLFKKIMLFHGKAIPTNMYNDLYEVESISGCFMMVSVAAIKQVGLLDEAFFFYTEDVDWCKRFYDAGWKIVYLSNVKSIHFGGESTAITPAKYQVIMEKSGLIYWTKHHGKTTVFFYKLLKTIKYSFSILSLKLTGSVKKNKNSLARIDGFKARINFLKKGDIHG